jgi:gliding motility-associated-like protein
LWTVESGSGDFVDNTSDSTYVRNVEAGKNIYKWTVTNKICQAWDTVGYYVSSPIIPEGISPNGDTHNDTLKITGLDYKTQDIELKIINSAGTMVFSAYRKAGTDGEGTWNDWTGNDMKGDPLPDGTYYYLLKVFTPETKFTAKAKGFIILKRH